jgi:hypothetical protein
MLMDWVGHHVDTAHWGLDLDRTGPTDVRATGEFPAQGALWNTATKFRVWACYAGGLEIFISGGYDDIPRGAKWIGDDGWIWVDRSGIDAHPKSILTSRILPHEIQLPHSPGHHQQFIDCVRTRRPTLTPPEVALRSATPGYLGNISLILGRLVRWDPAGMEIIGDPEASRLLSGSLRSPWRL